MKYAVTDIGANTVKISIYSVENGAAKHIISQSTPVGLAGYAADGVLSDTGISELAAVVSDYEKLGGDSVRRRGILYRNRKPAQHFKRRIRSLRGCSAAPG